MLHGLPLSWGVLLLHLGILAGSVSLFPVLILLARQFWVLAFSGDIGMLAGGVLILLRPHLTLTFGLTVVVVLCLLGICALAYYLTHRFLLTSSRLYHPRNWMPAKMYDR